MNRAFCILEDKECTSCMECQTCDLNKNIECTNCGKCIENDTDYKVIEVDSIVDGIIEE